MRFSEEAIGPVGGCGPRRVDWLPPPLNWMIETAVAALGMRTRRSLPQTPTPSGSRCGPGGGQGELTSVSEKPLPRVLVIAAMLLVASCSLQADRSGPSPDRRLVAFEIRVSQAHKDATAAFLESKAAERRIDHLEVGELRGTKGWPLAVFVGMTALPTLVDSILDLHSRLVRPGITIDVRNEGILIETDGSLPPGTVFVVSDGAESILLEPYEARDATRVLEVLSASKPR